MILVLRSLLDLNTNEIVISIHLVFMMVCFQKLFYDFYYLMFQHLIFLFIYLFYRLGRCGLDINSYQSLTLNHRIRQTTHSYNCNMATSKLCITFLTLGIFANDFADIK